jgi:phosphatidate cytidylyltransferase
MAGIFALLVVATLLVAALRRLLPAGNWTELGLRVRTWWSMAGVFAIALLLNRGVSLAFFALISFLALKEYLSMIPTRRADRRVLFWAYLAIPLQYLWAGLEWYGMFIIFIPVYVFLVLPMRMVLIGETKGFLTAVGTLHWGMMTTVFSLSHLAFLLVLPAAGNPKGGGAALALYLVVLTQLNDVAQYVSGRLLGRHRASPTVSPNKTVEGLLGGVIVTTGLAYLIAPLLTPLGLRLALASGVLISLSGFIGDLTISAIKRDLGRKDSGELLPGHGGILDRVDSMSFTAPLFFHFVYYVSF